MNYGTIKNCDIANGEGVRVSLFVSGCTHHCHNCFNPETWSFSYGSPFDEQAQSKLLTLLSPDYIDGLSLLGGEPFEPDNQRALVPFLKKVRAAVLRMIRMTIENGHKGGAWVGICGELGADTTLTKTFVDMGIDELSVSPTYVLGLRKAIREI